MIFSSKNLIPAAAFAAVASVAISAPAQALTFGNGPITVASDTLVEFEFISQDAGFFNRGLSSFGVCVISGTDCTPAATLFDSAQPSPVQVGDKAQFEFLSTNSYSLFLRTNNPARFLYSVNALNASGEMFADFGSVLGDIAWEDINPLPKSDEDYNDFVVNYTDVPTPAAVLPIIGGLLGAASKRKLNVEEA